MKIGIQELLLVFIVALIVLGPDKLPVYARRLGEGLREFRRFSSDATKDIRESIVEPLEEAQRPLREALEPITTLEKEIKGEVAGIQKSFSDIGRPAGQGTAAAGKADDADADRLTRADSPQAVGSDSADAVVPVASGPDSADADAPMDVRSENADAVVPVAAGPDSVDADAPVSDGALDQDTHKLIL